MFLRLRRPAGSQAELIPVDTRITDGIALEHSFRAGHLLRVGSSNRDRLDPQSDLEENLLEVFTLGLLKVASQDVLLSLRRPSTY